MYRVLLGALLLLARPGWATIAFVNSASATSGASTVTSLAITYSPTAGNTVFLGIRANGTFGATVTCADNNSNALTMIPDGNTVAALGIAVTGATSYTFSWSGGTARKASIVIGEYSGSITTPALAPGSSNSGASSPGTIVVTSTHTNSWAPAVISTGQNSIYGSSVGNFRVQSAAGGGNSNSIALVDNTAVTSGSSITDTLTISASTPWLAVAVEIWPTQPVGQSLLPLLGVGE